MATHDRVCVCRKCTSLVCRVPEECRGIAGRSVSSYCCFTFPLALALLWGKRRTREAPMRATFLRKWAMWSLSSSGPLQKLCMTTDTCWEHAIATATARVSAYERAQGSRATGGLMGAPLSRDNAGARARTGARKSSSMAPPQRSPPAMTARPPRTESRPPMATSSFAYGTAASRASCWRPWLWWAAQCRAKRRVRTAARVRNEPDETGSLAERFWLRNELVQVCNRNRRQL